MEKPRVLLADDNEATCTLIVALLRNEFDVDVVGNGQEAIERLRSRQYAAVLLDLLMPNVDGYAVLDFLRCEKPELLQRVLIVTASLSARAMERVSGYEVCRVVPKPFDVEVLQNLVRHCAGTATGASFLTSGMLLLIADVLRRM